MVYEISMVFLSGNGISIVDCNSYYDILAFNNVCRTCYFAYILHFGYFNSQSSVKNCVEKCAKTRIIIINWKINRTKFVYLWPSNNLELVHRQFSQILHNWPFHYLWYLLHEKFGRLKQKKKIGFNILSWICFCALGYF